MVANNSALRVLVVEDDALLRWALVETLTAVGHTVVEAVDGAGALGKVRDGIGAIRRRASGLLPAGLQRADAAREHPSMLTEIRQFFA